MRSLAVFGLAVTGSDLMAWSKKGGDKNSMFIIINLVMSFFYVIRKENQYGLLTADEDNICFAYKIYWCFQPNHVLLYRFFKTTSSTKNPVLGINLLYQQTCTMLIK